MTAKRRARLALLALASLVAFGAAGQTVYWTYAGTWSQPHFSSVSTSVGGTLLLAGGCVTPNPTVTVTGATVGMGVQVTPTSDPGNIAAPFGWVSAQDTVTLKICAILAVTPNSTTYSVKVLQ